MLPFALSDYLPQWPPPPFSLSSSLSSCGGPVRPWGRFGLEPLPLVAVVRQTVRPFGQLISTAGLRAPMPRFIITSHSTSRRTRLSQHATALSLPALGEADAQPGPAPSPMSLCHLRPLVSHGPAPQTLLTRAIVTKYSTPGTARSKLQGLLHFAADPRYRLITSRRG